MVYVVIFFFYEQTTYDPKEWTPRPKNKGNNSDSLAPCLYIRALENVGPSHVREHQESLCAAGGLLQSYKLGTKLNSPVSTAWFCIKAGSSWVGSKAVLSDTPGTGGAGIQWEEASSYPPRSLSYSVCRARHALVRVCSRRAASCNSDSRCRIRCSLRSR